MIMFLKNLFLTLSLGFSFIVLGQEKIEFSNEFSPETNFVSTTQTISKTELNFEGSEEVLERLKSKGYNNPTVTVDTNQMVLAYITGKSNKGSMPIEIKYLETGMAPDGVIRNGESLKGTYNQKDKIKLTELPDDSRLGLQKDLVLNMLNEGLSLELFNSGVLSIGDSVTMNSPMNIPLGSNQINLEIQYTYVLKRIESGKAFFESILVCVLKSDLPEIKLSATGGGFGKCTYDIANKRIVTKNSVLKMTMNAEIQSNLIMHMTQELTTNETTVFK